MQQKSTEIVFVLDRSGSMSGRSWSLAQEGLENFVTKQQQLDGTARMTLTLFDSRNVSDVVFTSKDVTKLNPSTLLKKYRPRDCTPLWQATAVAVESLEDLLRSRTEKPDHVIVVVFTDGGENSSEGKYGIVQNVAKLLHKKREEGWQFVFLGSDQNAYDAGKRMGFLPENIACVKGGKIGKSFDHVSTNIVNFRTTGDTASMTFSEDQLADLNADFASYYAELGIPLPGKAAASSTATTSAKSSKTSKRKRATNANTNQATNAPPQLLGEGKTWIRLECPCCKAKFWRERRNTHWAKNRNHTYCSRSCSSSHSPNGEVQTWLEQVKSETCPV